MLLRCLLPLAALSLASCASPPVEAEDVTAVHPPLHVEVDGAGEPALVFISGNGADLTAWAPIMDAVSEMNSRVVRYDRAGLGQSPLSPPPYSIDDEAAALERALADNAVSGPIVIVAHSYGGLIGFLLAENSREIVGMVLVDALIPTELSPQYTDMILAQYRPQYDMVRAQAPQLAKAVIPVVEAYPETAARMATVRIRTDLPLIDIRAENGTVADPVIAEAVRIAHSQFVGASRYRRRVLAKGSGHNVMQDRPDVVIEAVANMLALTRGN
ncbi:alpha/beta hydrolase [Parvularcula sp. LCG005]|uniref:alpha/beta fold hydrolase n=1 Tax=Parvularcula sp. LCG005 TaxID=3078805 RepID=UPI002943B2CF|nr:alpha/beta hydrolase [Parvularcula sp. LCG005]WOI53869.1 alpha/beta hydrolase [Parvularcula sp. LCG005]